MAITFIDNQTIRFRTNIDESCDCLGQPFCQKINKNDQTKFQIKSTDIVSNGGFDVDLTGWNVYEAITGTATITNESTDGVCDGAVTITASGGVGGYTYSIDGTTFQGSSVFSNLCTGSYTVVIKDSEGSQGSISFSIDTNISCGDYVDSEAFDLLNLNTSQMLNCEANNFI